MRRARSVLALLLAVLLVATPGCLLGSPAAAFSGEPYGMVIDDVKAIQGKKGPIWAPAPAMAFFDIPIAFCLDTAFLPIALIVWGFKAISESDDSEGVDHEHNRKHTDPGFGEYEPRRRMRPAERELVPD